MWGRGWSCSTCLGLGRASSMNAMRRIAVWMALVLSLSMICCGMPEKMNPGDHYRLRPEGDWTSEERAELVRACADWAIWTDGVLSCSIEDDGTDGVIARSQLDVGKYHGINPVERTLRIDADQL